MMDREAEGKREERMRERYAERKREERMKERQIHLNKGLERCSTLG
jgi:hypothetical protein